jgi:hypothetical protein
VPEQATARRVVRTRVASVSPAEPEADAAAPRKPAPALANGGPAFVRGMADAQREQVQPALYGPPAAETPSPPPRPDSCRLFDQVIRTANG